jgi:hypothetical protein
VGRFLDACRCEMGFGGVRFLGRGDGWGVGGWERRGGLVALVCWEGVVGVLNLGGCYGCCCCRCNSLLIW